MSTITITLYEHYGELKKVGINPVYGDIYYFTKPLGMTKYRYAALMLRSLYSFRSRYGIRRLIDETPQRELTNLCSFLQTRLGNDNISQEAVHGGNSDLHFAIWRSEMASLTRGIERTLAEIKGMKPRFNMYGCQDPPVKSKWEVDVGDEYEPWKARPEDRTENELYL
ncbi:MAG: hypothetical protein Q9184_006998 [Pyrenodesmia sp. 2 TL-2023]